MDRKVTSPARKALEATREVNGLIRQYYGRIKGEKAQGKPVVWTYGLMPRELWVALDVNTIAVEHLPILLAARQVIGRYLDIAEQSGYGRDLCPFHTAMLGCVEAGALDADTEKYFATPDLIVASNVPCMAESKSFLHAADKYGVPYYVLDAPMNKGRFDPPERVLDYYADGVKGLLGFLAEHGLKMDMDRLSEVLGRSREMSRVWSDIDNYRKVKPTPVALADAFSLVFLPVFLPGRAEALETLKRVREEVKQRAESHTGVVQDERWRLLFLGIPPWYNLGLFNYTEKDGGVFVKGEFEYIMSGQTDPCVLDPSRPLRSLAKKIITELPTPACANRIELLRHIIGEFHIDGVVAANKRGCRNFPAGFRLIKDVAAAEFGVPTTVFDLDGLDLREYNDAQVKAHLDAFMETLARRETGSQEARSQ